MKKQLIVTTAVLGLMCGPAFAQNAPVSKPASGTFISEQQSSQWMASHLIGASVYGPDNKSIGDINDIVLAPSGTAEAAVIGVGGFLGVGEKNVAIPFKELKVVRKDNGKIDKVTLSMTKDDLKNAPTFMTFAEKQSKADRGTTGSTKLDAMPGAAKKPVE